MPEQLTLAMEGKPSVPSPSISKVHQELRKLGRPGGSSFLILSAGNGTFLQFAGNGPLYICEHRRDDGNIWRAHTPAEQYGFMRGVKVLAGGNYVEVRVDEWLTDVTLHELIRAFANDAPMPDDVHWRVHILAGQLKAES